MDCLKANWRDSQICEKITRALEPPETGHAYFLSVIDEILASEPQGSSTDSVIRLRERIQASGAAGGIKQREVLSADLAGIDRELSVRVKGYEHFDPLIQSTLRSAEVPFFRPESFGDAVDKSSSVVEYCKAVDLLLESWLGRKHLYPKLERSLADFQNQIYFLELNEPHPSAERVIQALGLSPKMTLQAFPLHKIQLISQSVLNGRILEPRFNVLDGLRAWAVVFLLFARSKPKKPLLNLKANDDSLIESLAIKLMALQDVRNPAAHRQTYPHLKKVDEIRNEVFHVIQLLQRIL
jgi:hypothetical protein